MASESMLTEDVIYMVLLFTSIPYGHVVKLAGSPLLRKLLCGGAGILICVLLIGYEGIIHSLTVVIGTYLIVQLFGPQHCHTVSFIFVFAYLLFFRICGQIGLRPPADHSNAVQLLVTLRVVGIAFEVHDVDERKKEKSEGQNAMSLYPEYKAGFLDYLMYGYSYIGLMTGPYYQFQTFVDMVHQDTSKISTVWPAIRNLKPILVFTAPYFLLSHYFPLSYMETSEYLNHPWGLTYQLLCLVPTFTWFRWRFYLGWMLAEAMCMTAGLGAYPAECASRPGQGPTKPIPDSFDPQKAANENVNGDTHDFSTISTIDILAVEFGSTMRGVMRVWNKTIQWWMANFVYKKLPLKNPQVKMFMLLFVSAFWHGVHPGYYLTFLSVPLVVIAESRVSAAVAPYLSEKQKYWYDWASWFCLYRSFEYLGVGFMLLRLTSIWRVWSRMYFVGHLFILLFIILPAFIPRKTPERKPVDGIVSSKKIKAE